MAPSLEHTEPQEKKTNSKQCKATDNWKKFLIKLVLQAHWDCNSKVLTLLSVFLKDSASIVQLNKYKNDVEKRKTLWEAELNKARGINDKLIEGRGLVYVLLSAFSEQYSKHSRDA